MIKTQAQNLVPNPGFEEYVVCGTYSACKNLTPNADTPCYSTCCNAGLPDSPGHILSGTKNWWTVSRVNYVYGGSPVYISGCIINNWVEEQARAGYHVNTDWYTPHTGNAYILIRTYGGFYPSNPQDTTNTRDYAQVRLIAPLQAGCMYEASCYILNQKGLNDFQTYLFQGMQQADGFGLHFSKDSVYRHYVSGHYRALTDITPQVSNPAGHLLTDTVRYQKLSGVFTATGGEEWLVLGNFKDNAHTQAFYNILGTAVYAVDDISVQEWKPDLVSFTDTIVCTDSMLTITLPAGLKNYKWSTGETSRQIIITAGNGRYTVEASNGCSVLRDTFYIHAVHPYGTLDIGKDTFFCRIPETYAVTAPLLFDSYRWSSGSTAATIGIQQPGRYWLEGTYACGILSDTVEITEFVKPDTILVPAVDTALCSNAFLDLHIANAAMYNRYTWNDGSTGNTLRATQAGIYSMHAYTPEGCEVFDSINVSMIYPPEKNNIPDTLLCLGTELVLTVTEQAGNTIRWYDGETGGNNTIYQPGIYWVDALNRCYTVSDTFHVTVIDCQLEIPNLITVNGDDKNDFFEIKTAVNRTVELTLYNSWGNKVYENEHYQNDWNAFGLDAGLYYYQINDPVLKKKYSGWLHVMK